MDTGSFTQALPAGYLLGSYRIERALQQGGFGITYIASHRETGDRVVIKENLPASIACREGANRRVVPLVTSHDGVQDFQWALKSFLDEANMLVSLDHPNIVKVQRAFSALGTAYYVMPYVGGVSLEQWARKHKRPGRRVVLELLRALLSALEHVHAHGILHRDVKPSNILMRVDGGPVLIDFGAARHIISSRTATLLHSPGYTPLEQTVTDGNCGPWSDLYALGATAYTLITGKRPPDSASRLAKPGLLRPLVEDAALAGVYGEKLLAGIDKALAVQAEARWQSAGEWLQALEPAALPEQRRSPGVETETEDIPLHPVPTPWRRKKRMVVAAVCCVAAVLVGGGGLMLATKGGADTAGAPAPQEPPALPVEPLLVRAISSGRPDTVRVLLENGADPNTKNSRGEPVLFLAITVGDESVVRLLLEKGADANACFCGQTPLGLATDQGKTSIMSLLFEKGADVRKADLQSDTPFSKVMGKGGQALTSFLQMAASRCNDAPRKAEDRPDEGGGRGEVGNASTPVSGTARLVNHLRNLRRSSKQVDDASKGDAAPDAPEGDGR